MIRIGQQIVGYSNSVEIRSKDITIKIDCRVCFFVCIGKKKFADLDFGSRFDEKSILGYICNDATDYRVLAWGLLL